MFIQTLGKEYKYDNTHIYIMEIILQNIQTKDSTYYNNVSYRQCLRNMFEMNEKIPHKEIDDITNDENNYDEESMSKAMDIVYEKTRDNVLFQKLYQHGAEKMFSVEKEIGIDLIVMGPKSNSIKEEVFLGSTSGSVVKQSNIPVLIVPEAYVFKPFNAILTAFRTGIVNKENVLDPLKFIKNKFNPVINLLLVKTPKHVDEDLILNEELESLKSSLTITENATTFQGVLEHFQSHQPDMLCVFRRKRGFFNKLWEKNTILKKEFHCNIPLLVLGGKQ